MTFDSSTETVAVLYDIENAPFEMLDYALGKSQTFMPCRMIVVSDWEKIPDQRRWNHLMEREGFTFRQIDRKVLGKNSLDYALFDMGILLYKEGVRRFVVITTDADFIELIEALRKNDDPAYVMGIGTDQANHELREAYDKFFCYPIKHEKKEEAVTKKTAKSKAVKTTTKTTKTKATKPKEKEQSAEISATATKPKAAKASGKTTAKAAKNVKAPKATASSEAKVAKAAKAVAESIEPTPIKSAKTRAKKAAVTPNLQVKLPKTLYEQLQQKSQEENVELDQLVTYLLMRGLMHVS